MTASPSSHYAFETLADGVYFGRARTEGTAMSNTGIIDLGLSTLVFDTSVTLRSAREIRAAALARTGRAPSLTVNSHWHLDHLLGNQLFQEGPIYATRRTVEILLERREELETEISREKLEADARELERQRGTMPTENGPAPYDAEIRILRALLDEAIDLRLTLPTERFERAVTLPGVQDARLLTYGPGHTESDTVLFLGRSRTLFAGDLVVSGTHPNLTSGDPEHWLTVLDRIEELRPDRIGTGHGPVGSTEAIETMRDYLSMILDVAERPDAPEIPARFRSLTGPKQFLENVAYARARSSHANAPSPPP